MRRAFLFGPVEALGDEQLRPVHMIGCERGVGRPARQTYRTTAQIRDIGVVVVALQNSANVSDVVSKTRQYEIGIVVRGRRPQQLPSHQDVVPGKGNQHRMLDVVIQCVAVADAIKRQPGGEGDNFSQAGM
jgi:hypothetical protein